MLGKKALYHTLTPQEGRYTEEPQLRHTQRFRSERDHLLPLQLLLGSLSIAIMNLHSSSSSSGTTHQYFF
jgi:hypothetical protein